MRGARPRYALVAAALAATLGGACTRGASPAADDLPAPLVVVAVDGLEWRLVLDLIREGRLPNLAGILASAASGRLATLEPAISPRIWTSIATGVSPERHGILGFQYAGSDGEPRLFASGDRRVKAIWNIASDAGRRACVVGYWATFPAEAIEGVVVAQTARPPSGAPPMRKGGLVDGAAAQVHPPELEERVFALARRSRADAVAAETSIFGDTSAWPAAMRRLVEHSRWSIETDAAYRAIAIELASEPARCDLLLVYLALPDVLGHRFWRWTYPEDFAKRPTADRVAAFGDVLPQTYAWVDEFLGRMHAEAQPNGALVVVSDHGMGAFRPRAAVDLERSDGPLVRTGGHSSSRLAFFAATGRGLARSDWSATAASEEDVPSIGSVLDVGPTLLALLGFPHGADMEGRPLAGALAPELLAAHPLREVATHTPPGWRAPAPRFDDDDGERLEQLRGLGYLD